MSKTPHRGDYRLRKNYALLERLEKHHNLISGMALMAQNPPVLMKAMEEWGQIFRELHKALGVDQP